MVKTHWSNFVIKGSGSYIIMEKTKAFKLEIKTYNREVFGRVNYNKLEVLNNLSG